MFGLLGRAWSGVTHLAWYIAYKMDGDERSRSTP
jgi:hypothetical protein